MVDAGPNEGIDQENGVIVGDILGSRWEWKGQYEGSGRTDS